MKIKLIVFAVMFLLSFSLVFGEGLKDFEVPLEESTFSRCQNGVRESSESCDLGHLKNGIAPGEDLCPDIGKILGIVQVCRSETCTCIIDRMDCGNGIREGAEWCDPGEKIKDDPEKNDLCPQLSELLGRNMTCNPDSCLCKAATSILESVTCGDGKIEYNEQCEEDSDCDAGKECKNCKCLIKVPEMNQSEIDELINQSDIPTPEEKEEIEKQEEANEEFDYHDLVGEDVPEFFYSDFKNTYTNVIVDAGESDYIVGVRTKYNVVQEIIDGGYEEPTREVFVSEADAQSIVDSSDRMDAFETAVLEGKITYNAKGIFSRMWMWFKGIFR
ncbi:hypothetical protein GF358_03710 [Candidatus Woesearchaeota archaeon]|nr:hypothetical protein [Candidatus Woesearchaeota archaeon]